MTVADRSARNKSRLIRPGDPAIIGILASDFFGALAGATVYITMVWWVLEQGASELGITLLVLAIFIPMNIGALISGVAVEKFGARKLLLFSKTLAFLGAILCFVMLSTGVMTLWKLAGLAALVYGAMGPSISADSSRAPTLTRLAKRKLASFHATNGIVMVVGQMGGLLLGGYMAEGPGASAAIALSALLVGLSLMVTFLSFPRDRVGHAESLERQGAISLTRSVVGRLDAKVIGVISLLVTVIIVTVAEGYAEVVLPIALRANGLPPSELSIALGISVIASVVAMLIAQAVHGRYRLNDLLSVIGISLVLVVSAATLLGGWIALVIIISATTAAASAAATLTFTSLQESMTTSLQAQASGVWQSVVMTASIVVIFLTGFLGQFSADFLVGLIGCSAILIVWRAWRDRSA